MGTTDGLDAVSCLIYGFLFPFMCLIHIPSRVLVSKEGNQRKYFNVLSVLGELF
jgi:hypothetical protein